MPLGFTTGRLWGRRSSSTGSPVWREDDFRVDELPDDLQHELKVSIRLARRAGEAILGYYRRGLPVERKAGDEPVTLADRVADDLIRAGLRDAFPDDGLLTEESADDLSRLAKERVWIVDPLDGTTEFITETGDFVVQVGLAVGGEPVLGVIYQPTTGLLYHAARGQGAYRHQNNRSERLHVSTTADPRQMRLVASHAHYSPLVQEARRALGLASVRRMGSVGLKAGMLAAGECDLYLATTVAKEWDLCAPHALILEAGGILTNLCGERVSYNKPRPSGCRGLIASNGQIHEHIVRALAPLVEKMYGPR